MKAIALISGGLDSMLAAKLIQGQGIDVVGLKFKMSFSLDAKSILPDLGFEIREININEEFLELIKNPRYGYGSNVNPCIDCKILMLTKAKEFMEQVGARFIVTGEVLGQRPMSQHKQALHIIAKRAALQDLVLRPLSAKLLPETIPEKEGWVNREKLLSFSGRGRRSQIELAKALGIIKYAQPAGGCLLTDPQFARRIKDLLNFNNLTLDNLGLLKTGRHFRLSPDAKLVVGRNEKDNERLPTLVQNGDYLFMPSDIAGPTALGRGSFDEGLIRLSCIIVCRYCDLNGEITADIAYRQIPQREEKISSVSPIQDSQLQSLRI